MSLLIDVRQHVKSEAYEVIRELLASIMYGREENDGIPWVDTNLIILLIKFTPHRDTTFAMYSDQQDFFSPEQGEVNRVNLMVLELDMASFIGSDQHSFKQEIIAGSCIDVSCL